MSDPCKENDDHDDGGDHEALPFVEDDELTGDDGEVGGNDG